ncbi:MAG: YraN family protein [Candidatus Omnitrophota bacterium]
MEGAQKQRLGKEGEKFAVEFLQGKGYKILERNYRCRLGEIDIIAKEAEVLCFIEVKTRTQDTYGRPYEAVNKAKQNKIGRIALMYLKENGLSDIDLRFDVASVFIDQSKRCHEIELIRDAFSITEKYYF